MSAAYRKHRQGKAVGTFVLKGTFAGIHIERASGTTDPKRLRDLRGMCNTLASLGRLDILEALARPRGLRPLDVWRHSGNWAKIPTPEHAQPLAPALEAWRTRVAGVRRRADLRSTIRVFLGDTRGAVVAAIPEQLQVYRVACQRRGVARQFNKVRAELSAFVRDTLGPGTTLWLAIRAVAPLPVRRKIRGQPQSPAAAAAIRATLDDPLGAAWWVLCCTGMMPDEYFGGKWALEDGRLHVRGTKREARDRYVPVVVAVTPSPLTAEQFRRGLKRAGLGVRPYDGRRTFAHWCDLAGIPLVRRELYLGHATGYRMDTLYGAHESERLVDADAGTLRDLFGGISSGTAIHV